MLLSTTPIDEFSFRLAEYIESEPERKKAQLETKKAKLEALEKKLGINQSNGESSSEPLAGKKHRLEDTEYVEQSREIVDNVKSAVTAGEYHIVPDRWMRFSYSTPVSSVEEEKED